MNRLMKNAGAPDGVVVFNYARSKVSLPASDEIPTLIPGGEKNALFENDPAPFFKVEAIDFPAKGTGGVYDGSFFKSFINVCKDRPIPGSKRGHEWVSRGNSDFYTVGGRIDSSDGGKTGTAFLKVYMPPKGDTTDNTGLIRDARAGIVHFSLVTKPDYNVKTEEDDMGNKVQVRHFTATMGAERNDAMEYGAGAMTQIVNSSGNALDIDAARALIEAGKFDITNKIGDDAIQNGIVYRSALRRLASRANEEDRAAIGELLSLIDKSSTKGGKPVEKNEIFEALKNLVVNAKTNIREIADAVGLGALVRNETDDANAATVKTLNEKLGEKPLEKLDAVLAENKANAVAIVENAVQEITPKTVKNAEGADVENPSFKYAMTQLNGKSGADLTAAIEALKKDHVMLALESNRADGTSSTYISADGKKPAEHVENSDGIETITIGRE